MMPVHYFILLAILVALVLVGSIVAWRSYKTTINKKLYDILDVVGGYEDRN